MRVGERLHGFIGGNRNGPAAVFPACVEADFARSGTGFAPVCLKSDDAFRFACRNPVGSGNGVRSAVLKTEEDIAGIAVEPFCSHFQRFRSVACDFESRRGCVQSETRTRFVNPQIIGIVFAAESGCVGKGEAVSAADGGGERQIRIRMLHERSGFYAREIVVQREEFARGVVKPEKGIERRSEPPGEHFHDDRFPLFELQMEELLFSRFVECSADHDAAGEDSAGFRFHGRDRKSGRLCNPVWFRSLFHGDAVNEIVASAEKCVADDERVLPVIRHVEFECTVGIEVSIVDKTDPLFRFVENFHLRLEEPRHAVADKRHQSASEEGEREDFPFFRAETEIIGFSGHDLAVKDGGRLKFRDSGFFRRKRKVWITQFAVCADVETERIADASVGNEPEFPFSRFRVGRDPQFDDCGAGDCGTCLQRVAGNQKKTQKPFHLKRFEFVELVVIRMFHPAGCIFRQRRLSGFAFPDRAEPVHQIFALGTGRMRKAPDLFDSGHGNAGSGDQGAFQSPELLSADDEFHIGSLFSPGGEQITDVESLTEQCGQDQESGGKGFHADTPPFLYSSRSLFLPSPGRIVRSSPRGFGSFAAGSMPASS